MSTETQYCKVCQCPLFKLEYKHNGEQKFYYRCVIPHGVFGTTTRGRGSQFQGSIKNFFWNGASRKDIKELSELYGKKVADRAKGFE